jgi:hypothetical protein
MLNSVAQVAHFTVAPAAIVHACTPSTGAQHLGQLASILLPSLAYCTMLTSSGLHDPSGGQIGTADLLASSTG